MTLSPSQQKILACLKRRGHRYLPKEAVIANESWCALYLLGCRWEWSWEISQECKTADYRRRIHELNQNGHEIISFHVGNRHGYLLASEPQKKEAT